MEVLYATLALCNTLQVMGVRGRDPHTCTIGLLSKELTRDLAGTGWMFSM